MKLFKKIILPVVAGVCALAAFATLTACGETDKYAEEDDATNWDYTTYVVYLKLPDGSPVADVGVEICSDVNCLDGTTNEDGRVSLTFESSQQNYTVYMHFPVTIVGLNSVEYEGPDGYTLPEGSAEYAGYSHVWYLTEKVTTFTFVAE